MSLVKGRVRFVILAGCLTVTVALAVLWCRSVFTDRADQLLTFRLGDERYTLRSQAGRIVLRRPRLGPPAPETASWVRQLSNDDTVWDALIKWTDDRQSTWETTHAITGFTGASARVMAQLEARSPKMARQVMLVALEDPKSFAIAHLWLASEKNGGSSWNYSDGAWKSTSTAVARIDGLFVEARLPPPPSSRPANASPVVLGRDGSQRYWIQDFQFPAVAHIRFDPAELPAIRRKWHDLLDADVGSTSYVWPFLIFFSGSLFGVMILLRRWRVARRRVAGLCVACGYDLRASYNRCPECGGRTIPTARP